MQVLASVLNNANVTIPGGVIWIVLILAGFGLLAKKRPPGS